MRDFIFLLFQFCLLLVNQSVQLLIRCLLSIEVGKSATLFIADGDPFEPATQVTAVFIDGYQIPLVSRQTELFEEYLNRSPGLRTVSETEE